VDAPREAPAVNKSCRLASFPGCSLALGTWHLALGTWHLALPRSGQRIGRAGLPAAMVPEGIFPVTTEDAPMTA